MSKSLKNSTSINVKLITEHIHNEETDYYRVEKSGELVYINGHYYIRYEDKDEDGDVSTTVKIHSDGSIIIIRRAALDSRMVFETDRMTQTEYYTPYGKMMIDIHTHKIEKMFQSKPFSGELNLEYNLFNTGRNLGRYNVNLKFSVQ